jgi:hypothetical protein
MSRCDCQRSLQILSDVVCRIHARTPTARSYVGAPDNDDYPDDRKVTSLKPRRVVRMTGPCDIARPN